jgi:hypothetical protein
MGASYTMDLREGVVEAFRTGMGRAGAATLFRVSKSPVQRWSRLDREKARRVVCRETWAKTNTTPLRGRCPVGQRRVAKVIKVRHGDRKTLTFVAALRWDGIYAPCVLNQPVNASSFRAYFKPFLVPTLCPGDVVVMDNLSSHKSKAIRRARSAQPVPS